LAREWWDAAWVLPPGGKALASAVARAQQIGAEQQALVAAQAPQIGLEQALAAAALLPSAAGRETSHHSTRAARWMALGPAGQRPLPA
jgi:hypothetical protein